MFGIKKSSDEEPPSAGTVLVGILVAVLVILFVIWLLQITYNNSLPYMNAKYGPIEYKRSAALFFFILIIGLLLFGRFIIPGQEYLTTHYNPM